MNEFLWYFRNYMAEALLLNSRWRLTPWLRWKTKWLLIWASSIVVWRDNSLSEGRSNSLVANYSADCFDEITIGVLGSCCSIKEKKKNLSNLSLRMTLLTKWQPLCVRKESGIATLKVNCRCKPNGLEWMKLFESGPCLYLFVEAIALQHCAILLLLVSSMKSDASFMWV